MLGFVEIVAGLGWDPEIRGLLTVVLAMAVLAGSVWLLLVTNTGTRLGSLIALAWILWMDVRHGHLLVDLRHWLGRQLANLGSARCLH